MTTSAYAQHRNAEVLRAEGEPKHPDFKQELISLIPQLRGFARSLCRDASRAEDLAQDALSSAWKARSSYRPGTNLRAWLYLILRNQFYSDARREWRTISLSPEITEATLVARDNVECILELGDVRWALTRLTEQHREALILVAVGGFSYDDAAEILHVPTGSVKSRVCRARTSLLRILASGAHRHDGQPAGNAFDAIIAQLSHQGTPTASGAGGSPAFC